MAVLDEIETRRFCRCAIAVNRRTPRRTRRTRRPTALRRAGSTDRLDPAGPAREGGRRSDHVRRPRGILARNRPANRKRPPRTREFNSPFGGFLPHKYRTIRKRRPN
ncbi:hypothetical protein PMC2000_27065 [Burkholderia pseudomallei]|uniref:Uncharacterized protein n=1 Tax=Burkholderia pseudomallei TaxID=28450 RepID=A0AAX0U254_BURPE|nr:hypothetical protein BHT10_34870 [Burkholderia pseudomallei]MUU87648.1 hypothetical protein [Burkholderia pseudomallei]PJO62556.1 hypothetical protein CWD88_30655 [Burkholderia pseudomallei]PPF07753.1 hypothetical protein B9D88_008355 [Burkholderia pseudomallei]QGS82125.1 hypothetical protein PMC2000_27065 [Burkholderia pseudomallei]